LPEKIEKRAGLAVIVVAGAVIVAVGAAADFQGRLLEFVALDRAAERSAMAGRAKGGGNLLEPLAARYALRALRWQSGVQTRECQTGVKNMLRINDDAPNFTAETSQGTINFHEWIGNGWAILFSHPKDFTPVCTTELGYMAGLEGEFKKRNCKIIGLSVDPVTQHSKWAADIEATQGHKVNYPMIGDPQLKVAKQYDMLPAESGDTCEGRTAANNATVRTVFIVGPDKKIKLMLSYPMSTGRNFDEVLRVLDSIQLTAKHKVATPVNWKQGDDVIILPAVSEEEAKLKYPGGWKSPRPYLRIVPQPK
jgi:alkyl hydroperoxide reductase subunit AhpC